VLLITIVAFFEYRERDLIEYPCRPPKCNQKEKVICKENIENIRIDQLGRGLKKIENICKTEKSNLIWSYNNCLINVTEHGEINEPLAFYSETVECYDQKGNVLPDIN
jgi:hypothetical protein